MSSKVLLIDGHSMAYRAFYALPVDNFSTSTGQHTNAVYGFTSMLINLLRDEQPDYVAVAFDVSRTTFRSEVYPEYKAHRSASPAEFSGQVNLIKEVLQALRVASVQVEGYEADDIIATLTAQAQRAGHEVVISSGDRDAIQLVTDSVSLLYPVRGVSELIRMTPAVVEERYGVPPQSYPDLAALVGETSDNLPGVPGVGAKTAAKWIAAYGTVADIVAAADDITGKVGMSLRQHLVQVQQNRKINQLVGDVELPMTVADTAVQPWDREQVHQLFDSLEFRVLRERLFATLQTPEPEVSGGFVLNATYPQGSQVAAWLAEHTGDQVGVAVSVDTYVGGCSANAIAVATERGAAAWFDLRELALDSLHALAVWLADPNRLKVLHDAKPAIRALATRGLTLAGVSADTMISAYICHPDQRGFDLADLVVRHLNRSLEFELPATTSVGESKPPRTDGDQLSFDDLLAAAERTDAEASAPGTPERLAALVQARAVVELAHVLNAELELRGATALVRDIELPLMSVLADLENAGIAVDGPGLAALEKTFAAQVEQAQSAAWQVLGSEINLGSPKQLQVALFDTLGMPKTKKIKTGYTTDAEALTDLYAGTEHPFLAHLLQHRDATRLRVTVEGLQRCVADDGRIHTTYVQTIAATGRLSSMDPNLQNIPIRTEQGHSIRKIFVVGSGFENLLTADYSQIEMRIMAHLSGDAELIEAFASGEDLHAYVACRVFGVATDAVTPAMRSKIKAMSYGLAYGLSAYGLSKQLRVSVGEAKKLMDDYFDRFGKVRDYLHQVVSDARKTGYTETIFGRRRYLPDLTSDNRQRRDMAERMALNAPIQGSAADIIKVAMLRLATALREQQLRSRMLLQVHDELVLEVAAGERAAVQDSVHAAMAGAADLSVPLEVTMGLGPTWYAAGH